MKKNRQCPECGCNVIEVNSMVGWAVKCTVCDYSTRGDHKTRYEARIEYRDDFNECFSQGFTGVPVGPWQEKLDKGEI
jgi:ssDNA-binding Zn-finger/Zn-ribbon topoisomerase 1